MEIRPVSELVPRPIIKLWSGRLAQGKLAILDGEPGQGKSFVALDLCARVSRGWPFPGETDGREPANALILNGEDGAEDTIWQRLGQLGADRSRVFIPDKTDGLGPGIQFPANIADLDRVLSKTPIRLLVIDPIMAFLDPSISSASDQSVRRALTPLAQVAHHRQACSLLVRHPNKSGGNSSMYRGAGSVGIVGACRTAMLAASDPQTPNQHVIAHFKSNLGALQPSLTYRIVTEGDECKGLEWMGRSIWTADQLLAAAKRQVLTPRELARNFLLDFLADAPRNVNDIRASAENLGLTVRTVDRAKRELKIRSVRLYIDNQQISYWLLPEQALPDNIPPDVVPPSLEPWLKPLREKYPPQGPLEGAS